MFASVCLNYMCQLKFRIDPAETSTMQATVYQLLRFCFYYSLCLYYALEMGNSVNIHEMAVRGSMSLVRQLNIPAQCSCNLLQKIVCGFFFTSSANVLFSTNENCIVLSRTHFNRFLRFHLGELIGWNSSSDELSSNPQQLIDQQQLRSAAQHGATNAYYAWLRPVL